MGTASWSGAGFRGDWLAHPISPVLQPSDMQTFCLIFFLCFFFLIFSFASCPAGPAQPAHPTDEPMGQFHSIPIASRHPCVHPSSHPRFVATHCPIHPSLPTPTLHYLRNIRPSSHLASSSLTGKSWQGVSTSALSTTVSCPVGGGGEKEAALYLCLYLCPFLCLYLYRTWLRTNTI